MRVSGNDVAAAVIVNAIIIGDTPKISDKPIEWFVKRYVNTDITINAIKNIKNCL